jgi:16S rRNA (cytidine1402-2'-O)-methyltransferase
MLYVIATPIGNLEDITLRALRLLGEVDLIACEDTRHTRKLLTHYQIITPTISYHEHNERERATELITRMKNGAKVALVTDAGTPLVSDPGFHLLSEAIQQGITIVPIPGATAFVTALMAAGLPSAEFLFIGFLPAKATARRSKLRELASLQTLLIFYEAPHRLIATLEAILEELGNRRCVVARELTKLHEEFLRGTMAEVLKELRGRDIKGEFVLLIAPLDETEKCASLTTSVSIADAVAELMRTEGLDSRQALKQVARQRGISKSEAYRQLLQQKGKA